MKDLPQTAQQNLAEVLHMCDHTPETDEEIWNNPQDCWCDFHQCACCRSCFESHKSCKDVSGTTKAKEINEKRKQDKEKQKIEYARLVEAFPHMAKKRKKKI